MTGEPSRRWEGVMSETLESSMPGLSLERIAKKLGLRLLWNEPVGNTAMTPFTQSFLEARARLEQEYADHCIMSSLYTDEYRHLQLGLFVYEE